MLRRLPVRVHMDPLVAVPVLRAPEAAVGSAVVAWLACITAGAIRRGEAAVRSVSAYLPAIAAAPIMRGAPVARIIAAILPAPILIAPGRAEQAQVEDRTFTVEAPMAERTELEAPIL